MLSTSSKSCFATLSFLCRLTARYSSSSSIRSTLLGMAIAIILTSGRPSIPLLIFFDLELSFARLSSNIIISMGIDFVYNSPTKAREYEFASSLILLRSSTAYIFFFSSFPFICWRSSLLALNVFKFNTRSKILFSKLTDSWSYSRRADYYCAIWSAKLCARSLFPEFCSVSISRHFSSTLSVLTRWNSAYFRTSRVLSSK